MRNLTTTGHAIAATALIIALAGGPASAQEPATGAAAPETPAAAAQAETPEEAPQPGFQYDSALGVPVGWRGAEGAFLRGLDWGLEERLRYEVRDGIGFNRKRDDDFLLARTRLWLTGELASSLDFRLEGRDAHAFGDQALAEDNPLYEDTFDLFEGYLTAHLTDTLALRGGREALSFDDQRLLGSLMWTNTARSFDTIHGIWEDGDYRVDAGWARPVIIRPEETNDANDLDDLYYLHGTTPTGLPATKASAFAYYRDATTFDHTTLGARLWRQDKKAGGLEYDTTAAWQFGDGSKGGDLRAHALHGEVGWRWMDVAMKPRLALEANWASGDEDPADDDTETFDQLFPTNHNKYGIADLVGWRNQRNLGLHLDLEPAERFKFQFGWWAFWLDQTEDALYNAGGSAIVSPKAGSDARFVGHEVDAELSYEIDDHSKVATGVGYFFSDEVVTESSATDDDFIFAFAEFTFKIH